VSKHHRVVVDVDDPRRGQDCTRGGVDGGAGGQPGAQVDELADALLRGPRDGPGDKLPVFADQIA